MSTQPSSAEVPIRRIDRLLAYASVGIIVVSVICFFTIIIASAVGMQREDFAAGAWPLVAAIPLWGLPIGLLLMITLLVTSFVRRGRAARS